MVPWWRLASSVGGVGMVVAGLRRQFVAAGRAEKSNRVAHRSVAGRASLLGTVLKLGAVKFFAALGAELFVAVPSGPATVAQWNAKEPHLPRAMFLGQRFEG